MKQKFIDALPSDARMEYYKDEIENAKLIRGISIFVVEVLLVLLVSLITSEPWIFYSEDDPAMLGYDLEFSERHGYCNSKGADFIVTRPYYKNLSEEQRLQVAAFFDYHRFTLEGLKAETLAGLPDLKNGSYCSGIQENALVVDGLFGPMTQGSY